jgi:transcriptional regulator with XRE-family HTH domain
VQGHAGADRAGIVTYGERRVPGLRREELAEIAGISVPYLARLEQGRDRHPSPQVLAALAASLDLDAAETRYLHRLAEPPPPSRPQPPPPVLSPAVRDILDSLADRPALVLSPYRDVLAATPLATAVCPGFTAGQNIRRTDVATSSAPASSALPRKSDAEDLCKAIGKYGVI